MVRKMVSSETRPAAKRDADTGGKEGEIRFDAGIPAIVKELVGRMGSRGEITQVMCQIQEGRDQDKSIRRNVKGPLKLGDTLMLLETEIEAQRLGGGRRGAKPKTPAKK